MDAFYQRANFMTAAARIDQAPPDTGAEVAFGGRSNAGKSSAINTLCYQKQLARTSKTPGRTQQLIFFRLDDSRRLVDLPGYGYAKVSASIKEHWQGAMADYLERRRSLRGVVIVMDIRHPLTDFDQQMLAWGRRAGRHMLLLLTKSDKLNKGAARGQLDRVKSAVAEYGSMVQVELFSSNTRLGVDNVHALLDKWLLREE